MVSKSLLHDHGQALGRSTACAPEPANFQIVAELFKQLGDVSRIRIFWLLCHWQECVTNLSAMMQMSSPVVCHHLKQLKQASLVISHRNGKETYYRTADTEIARTLHRMIETMVQIVCPDTDNEKEGKSHEA